MISNHGRRRRSFRAHRRAAVAAGVLVALAAVSGESRAGVHEDSLDARDVVRLARTAPSVAAAVADIRAARGRLAAAYAPSLENPTLEGLGTIDGGAEHPRWEASIPVGLGPAWLTRIRRERRVVERETAGAADARRRAVGGALRAYYRALHADRRNEIAGSRRDMAERWFAAARERERAGEASRLDVTLAALERARARSASALAERAGADARLSLAEMLGLAAGATLRLRGVLDEPVPVEAIREVFGPERPDVRAAERDFHAASADQSLARMAWFPRVALRASREEEAGGIATRLGAEISVPLFQFGQAERAEAGARRDRAEIVLRAARARAAAERDAARSAAAAARAAREAFEGDGSHDPSDALSMVEEAYRAGKLDLAGLFVLRAEILLAQEEYADRLLDAALATIDEAVAEGVIP